MDYNNLMKLLIGLGNPGSKYENTRHNAGFMAVDYLVKHFDFEPLKMSEKHKAEVTSGMIEEEKVIFAKPQTFMNLSGQTVQSIANFYKIDPSDVAVVYDEADLPFGTLRIRSSGSAAGHNGIKSIIDGLGTDEFVRIRLGIKPEKPFPGALEDYVLGKLTEDEKAALNQAIEKLPAVLELSVEEAMQQFN